jgi:hypothetical protein
VKTYPRLKYVYTTLSLLTQLALEGTMAIYVTILEIYVTCAQTDGWQFEMTTWLTDLLQGNVTSSKSLYFGVIITSKSLINVKANA